MKRLLVAAFVILFVAVRADAAVVLDQQHNVATATADSTSGAVLELGQTFTVGVAGILDHIDALMLQANGIFTTNGDPQLSVYNTTAGVPSGAALTTVTVSSALVPVNPPNQAAFITFDVSGAAIPVTVGEVLAFGIFTSSDPGPYFVLDDEDTGAPDDYAGGAAFTRIRPSQPWLPLQLGTVGGDHEFQTFVNTVPEPTSCALAAISIFGLVCVALRRK